jgi:hypothetical protein
LIAAAALALADRSIPVFPCRPDKKPATAHGFLDASIDPATIKEWWKRTPAALIGVPTGTTSGFDVLDIDPRHGGERWWLPYARRIPPTRMHRTRSNGLHVLFRHADPVRNTEGKLASGVDTRGAGGYVIWWPAHGCRVAEAPIAAWPEWLLKALLARPKRSERTAPSGPALHADDAAQRIALRVLDRLAGTAAGQRHYALRKAAFTVGGLLDRLPFDAAEAERRLVHAISQAGAEDLENATKTAAWGLEKGRAAPLTMERR